MGIAHRWFDMNWHCPSSSSPPLSLASQHLAMERRPKGPQRDARQPPHEQNRNRLFDWKRRGPHRNIEKYFAKSWLVGNGQRLEFCCYHLIGHCLATSADTCCTKTGLLEGPVGATFRLVDRIANLFLFPCTVYISALIYFSLLFISIFI